MEHDEFVTKSSSGGISWGVQGFFRPVFIVWGIRGLLAVGTLSLLVLAPLLGFAFYSTWHEQFGPLAWVLPGLLAFYAGRPNLNLIAGLPWMGCALAGVLTSFWFGPAHLVGGILPCVSWFLSGALKGTTMMAMGDRLSASKDAYDKLKASGTLLIRDA